MLIAIGVAVVAAAAVIIYLWLARRTNTQEPVVAPCPDCDPPAPSDPYSSSPNPDGQMPWSANLGPKKIQAFLDKVGAYFQKQGLPIEIDAVAGAIKFHHPDFENVVAGLGNIADICAQLDQSKWDQALADHFGRMQSGVRANAEMERREHDFEQVKDLIHVRLYERSYLQAGPLNLVFREDLPGTVSILVYDLPDSIANVHPDQVEEWGKSEDELFRLGFANVRKNYPPRIEEQKTESGTLKCIINDNLFNTSHALLIEYHPELIGAGGSLLGVPHAGALICHPINDLGVLNAIQMLIVVIRGMHHDGPRSISDRLYWYREGKYLELPVTIDNNKLTCSPPEEFVEVLDQLKPAGGGGQPS